MLTTFGCNWSAASEAQAEHRCGFVQACNGSRHLLLARQRNLLYDILLHCMHSMAGTCGMSQSNRATILQLRQSCFSQNGLGPAWGSGSSLGESSTGWCLVSEEFSSIHDAAAPKPSSASVRSGAAPPGQPSMVHLPHDLRTLLAARRDRVQASMFASRGDVTQVNATCTASK